MRRRYRSSLIKYPSDKINIASMYLTDEEKRILAEFEEAAEEPLTLSDYEDLALYGDCDVFLLDSSDEEEDEHKAEVKVEKEEVEDEEDNEGSRDNEGSSVKKHTTCLVTKSY